MRKVTFAEGEVYHIYNRGTDRREVFTCGEDRYRFINDLYFMNDSTPIACCGDSMRRQLQLGNQGVTGHLRSKLVDILAYVIMPNHYHLIMTQKAAGGVSSFMHKLGTAYTMYFNRRYEHSGVLFQGPYQIIRLTKEAHFGYLPFYLHANPLKLHPDPGSIPGQMHLLEDYKWSSYRDYAGIPNFPEVIDRVLLEEYFDQEGGFCSYIAKHLKNHQNRVSEAQPPKEVEPQYL